MALDAEVIELSIWEKLVPCFICLSRFDDDRLLSEHLKSHLEPPLVIRVEVPPPQKPKSRLPLKIRFKSPDYKCEFCPQSF